MLTLPIGYHSTRLVFRIAGIPDAMGFGLAFGPYLDGDVSAVVAEKVAFSMTDSTMWVATEASVDWVFESVQDTQMLAEGPVTSIWPVNSQGTGTITSLPPNSALLVRKVTSLGGRTNRGRFYLPSYRLQEAHVNNAGTILSANLTAYQNDLEAFFTKLETEGLSPVLLHTDPAETPTPLVGFTAQSVIATQRRRIR